MSVGVLNKKSLRVSKTTAMHWFKLLFRSALFVFATVIYIVESKRNEGKPLGCFENKSWIMWCIWIVFTFEMVLRFFPSKLESIGCQKQFASKYKPKEDEQPQLQSWKKTALVAAVWIALNSLIGTLFFLKIIDEGILLLISLAYSIGDMVCILFFCPFQAWFMKNKCCATCRIYNWDYAMMFTPLIFVKNPLATSLVLFSFALLVRWEIAVHRHPKRFSENTNAALSCANCQEKLCRHKKQLQAFLKKRQIIDKKEKNQ